MISAAVFVVVVACLTMQLQAAEDDPASSLAHAYSEPTVRVAQSLQRRQSNQVNNAIITIANLRCTQQQIDNIFEGYPSDCNNALQTTINGSSVQPVYRTLCLPRCNQALVQFFSDCSTEGFFELFFHLCAINSNNNRCYDVFETLLTDSFIVNAACPSNRSSCLSTCRDSIVTFRQNSECCVNLYNNSATIPNFSFTADDYSLWAGCSVETPGFCTDSSVNRPGPTSSPTCSGTSSTQKTFSKLCAVGLVLLAVVTALMP